MDFPTDEENWKEKNDVCHRLLFAWADLMQFISYGVGRIKSTVKISDTLLPVYF